MVKSMSTMAIVNFEPKSDRILFNNVLISSEKKNILKDKIKIF